MPLGQYFSSEIETMERNGSRCCTEDAFTGLELVIAITVIILAAALFLFLFGETTPSTHDVPHGFIPDAVRSTGANLRPVNGITGFSAIDGAPGGIALRFKNPDRNQLGAVEMMIALFIGDDGGIDMDRAKITWMMNGTTEVIAQTGATPLICPNWTIARKLNMLPGQSADADNILEPNEQFDLIICPSAGAAPYQQFTVVISPEGSALPLPVRLTAPARILPVMALN